MKLKQYMLNEEKMSNSDIKMLKNLIKSPKNTTFTLASFSRNYSEDERQVDVSKIGSNIEFDYGMDFYDLTNELVDICDSKGYSFRTEHEYTNIIFTVIK